MISYKPFQRFKSKHKHKGIKNLNKLADTEIKVSESVIHEEYEYPAGMHEKLANHYNYSAQDSSALKTHTDDSSVVNNHLWNKHQGLPSKASPSIEHTVWATDKALTSHKTPHAMTVYAGVHYDPTSHGETVHHPAYMSTSLDHEVAKGFAQHQKSSQRGVPGAKHILAVHVPEGHSGAYVGHTSHVPAEREFILPRGMKLKHSHTDTMTGYSKIHRNPYPVHTHHMVIA